MLFRSLQSRTDLNVVKYIKTLVKSPSQVIEMPKLFNTYTIITSIGILLLILAFLSFVYNEPTSLSTVDTLDYNPEKLTLTIIDFEDI